MRGQGGVLGVPDGRVIRDELQRLVLADLLGPLGGPEEEFLTREDPIDRYVLSRLAPSGVVVQPSDQESLADAAVPEPNEGDPEPAAPNVPSLNPSALGFTTTVDGTATALRVTARWARYERAQSQREEHAGKRVWRRCPQGDTITVPLREGLLPAEKVDPAEPKIVVRGRVRRLDGRWLVSPFLENRQPASVKRDARQWIFQVELSATGVDDRPVFLPRPDQTSGGDAADQAERRRLAMAYRFRPEFAVGHGTAVCAEPAEGDPLRAHRVRTETVPVHELPATDAPNVTDDPDLPELAGVVLDMKRLAELADGPAGALTAVLWPLVTGYRTWIERTAAGVADPARRLADYPDETGETLTAARQAADRISAGIRLLADDPVARQAFGFANRAMYLQRVHSLVARARRKRPGRPLEQVVAEVDRPDNHRWRPFQLAFVLLNLPALADPLHPERGEDPDRAVADLLWFPTGGGKTEAYLGLTAFTIAVRRRQPAYPGRSRDGLAVLMRYTLRLLTIQQFERAATLVCAAETLRRADPATWGAAPVRIGLWVGGRVTPNHTDTAARWLTDRRWSGAGARGQGSPHQLTTCPWCGTRIEATNITVHAAHRRTLVVCPDVECPFSTVGGYGQPDDQQGLPVLLVDEEIYRHPPALLIATVDKFAQLAWKGETAALFGQVQRRCERHGYLSEDLETAAWERPAHRAEGNTPAARIVDCDPLRPPDLIIQDELHLISGPLGCAAPRPSATGSRRSTPTSSSWSPRPCRTATATCTVAGAGAGAGPPPSPPGSCWPATTGTSTTFPGRTSCTGASIRARGTR